METLLNIKSVPIIIAAVYLAIFGYKKIITAAIKNEKKLELATKFIPLISGVLGLILGIIAFYAIPLLLPAENVGVAIFIGLASGLAATGADQAFRQVLKKAVEKAEQAKKAEESKQDAEGKQAEEPKQDEEPIQAEKE